MLSRYHSTRQNTPTVSAAAMRVYQFWCLFLILAAAVKAKNNDGTQLNDELLTIPQAIHQVATTINDAIFQRLPGYTGQSKLQLAERIWPHSQDPSPKRTLIVAYKYPKDIIQAADDHRRRLTPEDGMVEFMQSLLQEFSRFPDALLAASNQLLGISRKELEDAQQKARRLSFESVPQHVEKMTGQTVQRLQRGITVLRLLNHIIMPLLGSDKRQNLNDTLEQKNRLPFHAMYLSGLHMEIFNASSEKDAETYRNILMNDTNVESVEFDQIIKMMKEMEE